MNIISPSQAETFHSSDGAEQSDDERRGQLRGTRQYGSAPRNSVPGRRLRTPGWSAPCLDKAHVSCDQHVTRIGCGRDAGDKLSSRRFKLVFSRGYLSNGDRIAWIAYYASTDIQTFAFVANVLVTCN